MSEWKSKQKGTERYIKGERENVREVDWSGDLLPFLMNWKIDKEHETGKNLLNLIHQEKEVPWLHQSQNLVFLKVEHFYQSNPRSHATWKVGSVAMFEQPKYWGTKRAFHVLRIKWFMHMKYNRLLFLDESWLFVTRYCWVWQVLARSTWKNASSNEGADMHSSLTNSLSLSLFGQLDYFLSLFEKDDIIWNLFFFSLFLMIRTCECTWRLIIRLQIFRD